MSEEAKIRHLEMIQGVINRLSANAFVLKGWAVSLIAALLGLSKELNFDSPLLLAIVLILIFWILDGYYLYLEKCYRDFFEIIRKRSEATSFDMNLPRSCRGSWRLFRAIFSIPNVMLFGTLIIVSVFMLRGYCGAKGIF